MSGEAARRLAFPAALFCCLLWGSAFPAVKAGLTWFPPTLFAGARFTLAGLAVLVLAAVANGPRALLRGWRTVLAVGFYQTLVGYWLFFHGMQRSSAVTAAIINASGAVVTAAMAWLLLGERRWTGWQTLGAFLGLAGAAVALVKPGWRPTFDPRGEGLILLSTVSISYAAVLVKRAAERTDVLVVSGGAMFSGGLALLALAFLTERPAPLPVPPAAAAILAYTAFLSATAFSVWYWLLRHNPVSTISTVKFTIPLFGVALSAMLLGERLTTARVLGGLLVGVGVALVMRRETDGPAAC